MQYTPSFMREYDGGNMLTSFWVDLGVRSKGVLHLAPISHSPHGLHHTIA